MRKIVALGVAGVLTLSLGACYTPEERAGGGALLGGATGAAIGAAASGGRVGPTLLGAGLGAATGAVVGASTAPGPRCPYGTYTDYYGNVYCR